MRYERMSPEQILARVQQLEKKMYQHARDLDRVGDAAALEGTQRQVDVHRVVLDEEDRSLLHDQSASGSSSVKVAPSPGRLSAQARPPMRSIALRTIASPMPVPG